MAIAESIKEVINLVGFLEEIDFEHLAKVDVFNDNQGEKNLLEYTVIHSKSEHTDIRYQYAHGKDNNRSAH